MARPTPGVGSASTLIAASSSPVSGRRPSTSTAATGTATMCSRTARIAADARTGKRLWHFQTLRHDLWDHDLPVYPNLVTVTRDGKKIDAVAQVTKTGYVFLFDRETGKPLFDVLEQRFPASDLPGEQASPTQPIPIKPPPFSVQFLDETNVTDIGAANRASALARLRKIRGGPAFNPPSRQGTVAPSRSPRRCELVRGIVRPATRTCSTSARTMSRISSHSSNPAGAAERRNGPFRTTGYEKFLDHEGYPAIKPPWGVLNAINLNTGEFAWRVPLGEYAQLTARGVPRTGTETFGGSIVTAGGLVFIAGSKDERIHAFDKQTGKLLWEHPLPAGGYATPSTFQVNGRQYVVIAAGGAGKLETKAGDAFLAFGLPAEVKVTRFVAIPYKRTPKGSAILGAATAGGGRLLGGGTSPGANRRGCLPGRRRSAER